jgi:hypothetical protein
MTDDDAKLLHHALACLASCRESIKEGMNKHAQGMSELMLARQAAEMARDTLTKLLQREGDAKKETAG